MAHILYSPTRLTNLQSWAQLFKTNDAVSNVSLKLIIKYLIYANIFAEKKM